MASETPRATNTAHMRQREAVQRVEPGQRRNRVQMIRCIIRILGLEQVTRSVYAVHEASL